MKRLSFSVLLAAALCLMGTKAQAYDLAIENADGVTIYYNYINDATELEVVTGGNNSYSGDVAIPEEVTYMNRTRKVTSIGQSAFYYCTGLTSVTIPGSVTSIGRFAFAECYALTSITIPSSVTSIEFGTFNNSGLTSVTISDGVTSIGDAAFNLCSNLTSITIPSSVTSIGQSAFYYCTGLTSVHISDIQSWCKIAFSEYASNPLSYAHHLYLNGEEIKDLVIPTSVTRIENFAFLYCTDLASVTIPGSVTSIGDFAFDGCSGLTSVTIPGSVTRIGGYAFLNCSSLTSVTIGSGVKSIGESAFAGCDIPEVISKIEEPFAIDAYTFSANTFYNATLYVPEGTIDAYKTTEGWNKFFVIEEGDGGDTHELEICDTPTISYSNGRLTFYCATEGATCHSSITDTDIASYSSNEVELTATYTISVYATKAGHVDSDVATATLCWIDAQPKTEGITNSAAQIEANAVLIQAEKGVITVNGAADGISIGIYNAGGMRLGGTVSTDGSAVIETGLQPGDIAIVKIGEKSVKITLK